MRYGKLILAGLLMGLLSACSSIGLCKPDQSIAEAGKVTETPAITAPVEAVAKDQVEQQPVVGQEQQAAVETTEAANTVAENKVIPSTQQPTDTTVKTTTAAATAPAAAAPKAATTTTKPAAPAATQPPANGLIALSMQMSYQQAWTRLGTTLPKAGYPIAEPDSNAGIYYILDRVGSGGTITQQTPIYQLHLQKVTDTKTRVFLYDAQNQPADPAVAQRMLGAIATTNP
jgi:uncharacterized lipoprotein